MTWLFVAMVVGTALLFLMAGIADRKEHGGGNWHQGTHA